MSWVRLDDQFAHHPKVLRAGPTASFLWIACIAYCQKFLTDGFVPERAIATICNVPDSTHQAEILLSVGLLDHADEGYQVHDYLEFNESAASVKRRREFDRQRKDSTRNPDGIQMESGRSPTRARAPAPHPIPSLQRESKEQILSVQPASGNGNGNGHEKDLAPAFIGWFLQAYKNERNGADYLVHRKHDEPIVRRLLAHYPFEHLQSLALLMLSDDCADKFIRESDRGLSILKTKANWLNDRYSAGNGGQRDSAAADRLAAMPETARARHHCPHDPPCHRDRDCIARIIEENRRTSA